VFDAVGGFENGVPEDKDWCERAGRQGYRIRFAPKSIVGHPARRTMPELKRKWLRLTLQRCEGARRSGKGSVPVLLRESAALLALARDAFAPLASKRLSGIRNRALAIGGLAQIRVYRFGIAHRAILGSPEK
jgi:GT2 family glycosyltransferase